MYDICAACGEWENQFWAILNQSFCMKHCNYTTRTSPECLVEDMSEHDGEQCETSSPMYIYTVLVYYIVVTK